MVITSSPERTKEAAIKSTSCSIPKIRSALSASLRKGMVRCTLGMLTPLWLLMLPPSLTVQRISVSVQDFTPTTGDEEINVYILIKHWEGDGEPDEAWLTSDDNALFTKMNLTGYGKITPKNNNFYILGLLMDIRQFKKAWDNASQTATKAIGAMRYFDLENAKVIYEVQ